MTVQLHAIAIYSRDGERRDVTFELGCLNIVTGGPRTGKSSLTGSGDLASLGSGTVSLANNSAASLTGSSDKVTLAASDSLTATGSSITLSGSGAADLVALNGAADTATLSNGTVALVSGSQASITLTGVTATAGATSLAVTGTGNVVSATSATIMLAWMRWVASVVEMAYWTPAALRRVSARRRPPTALPHDLA